ncbi:hemoglobin [Sphingobacterium allocomposti]|uniref:Hemoglobin n=1 Tax=Sphingobacterium allocomposti TaxID=415956 RepID=A0A5S5DK85_9SPHI|nr:group III truncated hemoglobin [Sphingobacterium composti Yoo et al. 2007 non Ten et al. 2007]TYP96327.1 hemoglobin [Sphingobacterium composti Yoo et al. 2007 non Ten et al. 2007]HLS94083.1 group III truncated hemoglobin [Sphingobacterium sp.]
MAKRDIETLDDIKVLVNTFYEKVQHDELIGPIFNERIQDRWPEHLEKMYTFWQTILLDEHTYQGRPFPPHAQLPIQEEHFSRWLTIFSATVDDLFQGTLADEAKSRGQKMAALFQIKLEHIRQSPFRPLL